MLTVADMGAGDTATVVEVLGDDPLAMRIMEMGVMDGEIVKVVGLAPMGDPMELEVRGYRLSLRKAEARRVTINLLFPSGLS
jgi:ferrous iron transport protein A